MIVATIAAPGLFYFVLYSGKLCPEPMHGSIENYWPYFWQVGYLLGMFVISDFFECGMRKVDCGIYYLGENLIG